MTARFADRASAGRALAESGLAANRLELEVTESGLAQAGPPGLVHLHRLLNPEDDEA